MTPDLPTDAIERCIEKANRDSSRIQVDARDQLAALKAKVANLRALLTHIAEEGYSERDADECPECGQIKQEFYNA